MMTTRIAIGTFLLVLLAAALGAGEVPRLVAADGEAFLELTEGGRVALPIPRSARSTSLAPVGGEGSWDAAGVDYSAGDRRLIVLTGIGTEARELATPAVSDAAELGGPIVLADGEGLRGLAWIEGEAPRRQTVRGAAFGAGGWSDPVTISPRGVGSQLALTAAALGQGAWLLAWSAFDGEDDEILWSRFEPLGGRFTVPRRLGADNTVPDITPALWVSAAGEVWAAWSRYDGNDYRLMVARFDDESGESWSEPRIAGPAGALYPSLHDGAGEGPLVLHLLAVPRGWAVAELDGEGILQRRASVATLAAERPLLEGVTAAGIALRWVGGGTAKARGDGAGDDVVLRAEWTYAPP